MKKVISDSRVMVDIESGEPGIIQQEVFAPGVPLGWIFTEGMQLTGDWNSSEKTYLPHRTVQNVEDVAKAFGLGNITLGLVQSASRKTADVAIMPGVVFEMTKAEITGNPLDVISSYLDVGDVIPVRIYRHPGSSGSVGKTRFSGLYKSPPIRITSNLVEGSNFF